MFFRFPPDTRWNPERSVVEFGIGIGDYEASFACPGASFSSYSRKAQLLNAASKPITFTVPGSNSSPSGSCAAVSLPTMRMSRSPVAICVNGKSGRITGAPSAIVGSLDEGGAASLGIAY
jgi:hypothetical protein